ncbi:hypothetical protein CFE70_005101 [Pyrenophora teres f. teres 0-1]
MENHERMRRQSYYGLDIVLTPCFDNEDADSFENVNYMIEWNTEVDTYLYGVPKVLAGCKKNLHNSKATLASLRHQNLTPISLYNADVLAAEIQALAYFGTSAVMGQGLLQLFDDVGHAVMDVEL